MIHENNQATIRGIVARESVYDHSVYGEGFYKTEVLVTRESGTVDTIPVMISERLISPNEKICGLEITVFGEFRSWNQHEEDRSRLILYLLAQEVSFQPEEGDKENEVLLNGFICKEPVYRLTPFGREIADLMVAVNRSYGKSDYIPCIAWGRNAKWASRFTVGTNVSICGRIQSRSYQKALHSGETETRTAYEVSVSQIKRIKEDPDDKN